mmetsp:Transcript_35506/g.85674  ORF Transcript_35506/g.85674 Transcript_35506/m.85674 type:complete len:231 (+) Transcript_35506:1822-2514(+)
MQFDHPVQSLQLVLMHFAVIGEELGLLVEVGGTPGGGGGLEKRRVLLCLRHTVGFAARSSLLFLFGLGSDRSCQKVGKHLALPDQILKLIEGVFFLSPRRSLSALLGPLLLLHLLLPLQFRRHQIRPFFPGGFDFLQIFLLVFQVGGFVIVVVIGGGFRRLIIVLVGGSSLFVFRHVHSFHFDIGIIVVGIVGSRRYSGGLAVVVVVGHGGIASLGVLGVLGAWNAEIII